MKNHKTRFLLILLALAPLGALSGQTSLVDLYLKPDIKSLKVTSLSVDDPRLGQAAPVLDDAKAALGWHFADFNGDIEGFVPDSKIGKDLLPVDDCIIYSEASSESTVLGIYKYGDAVEILDTGMWWRIRFGGGIPVYFVLDTPPPLPAITGTAELAQAPAPGDVQPTPAPMIEDAPMIFDEKPVYTNSGTNQVAQPKDQTSRPDVMGQSYEGVFKRSTKFMGLFKPKAAYFLENASGKRIAWIDTSEIVVPGSMQEFIGKSVIIYGERALLSESSRDWIIHARNMRLK